MLVLIHFDKSKMVYSTNVPIRFKLWRVKIQRRKSFCYHRCKPVSHYKNEIGKWQPNLAPCFQIQNACIAVLSKVITVIKPRMCIHKWQLPSHLWPVRSWFQYSEKCQYWTWKHRYQGCERWTDWSPLMLLSGSPLSPLIFSPYHPFRPAVPEWCNNDQFYRLQIKVS